MKELKKIIRVKRSNGPIRWYQVYKQEYVNKFDKDGKIVPTIKWVMQFRDLHEFIHDSLKYFEEQGYEIQWK